MRRDSAPGDGLPALALAAIVVKASSPGPVLFRQSRVGRDGKTFRLLKFRTMVHGDLNKGPGVTRQGDSRIFPAGRWLRHWKLDEVPQFFNVIRGDISLVGPRPDLPEYIASLNEEQREILSVRPGSTGAATLQLRNEERFAGAGASSPAAVFLYIALLPGKTGIDIAYARDASLWSDIKIAFRTLAKILFL